MKVSNEVGLALSQCSKILEMTKFKVAQIVPFGQDGACFPYHAQIL